MLATVLSLQASFLAFLMLGLTGVGGTGVVKDLVPKREQGEQGEKLREFFGDIASGEPILGGVRMGGRLKLFKGEPHSFSFR